MKCLTCENQADANKVYCTPCQVVKDDQLFGGSVQFRRLCGSCTAVSRFEPLSARVIQCQSCSTLHEIGAA